MTSERSAERLYGAAGRAYDAMTRLAGHERALRTYLSRAGIVRPGIRVLDAGCGSGAITKAIHDPRSTYYGFDLTPRMLDAFGAWIAARDVKNVSLVRADARRLARDLPPTWRDLDAIVSAGMLEYLEKEELPDVLREFGSRLARDGRMVVFICRDHAVNRWFMGRVWRATIYGEAELRTAFAAAGLRITSLTPFRTWGFAVEARRN